MIGERFARLTATSEPYTNNVNVRVAMYRCECGEEVELRIASVTAGLTRSCGCLRRDTNANKGTPCKCCSKRKVKRGNQTVCDTCKERYE